MSLATRLLGLGFLLLTAVVLRAGGNLLGDNPGFEKEQAGWLFNADEGMSKVSPEAAHSGQFGLRVTDESERAGSSVLSGRIPVTPGKTYRLSFWGRLVSGGGLGVYVKYYGSTGAKPVLAKNVDLPGGQTAWKEFQLDTVAPDNAETVEVWIHSYSPAKVVADIDDLSLEAADTASTPPWKPAYKLSPQDKDRLTEADVIGPDGLVYPDWRLAGVPGGIPTRKVVVGPEFFQGLEGQDIAPRLSEALQNTASAGGGAVELPPGRFFLDRPVLLRQSGVVVRGAGRDQTVLTSRNHIPRGEVRFYNWAETGQRVGTGSAIEIQANPKGLDSLKLEAGGKMLKEASRSREGKGWGNRFALRVAGVDLLAALGAGEHELVGTALYDTGESFSQRFKVVLVSETLTEVSPDQHGILVMVGPGKQGKEIPLQADGLRGSRRLALAPGHGLQVGDRILLDAPVTKRWSLLVGNLSSASHFRQYFFEVVAAGRDFVTLNQPLRLEFPVSDGSFVQKVAFVEGSGVEDLTIVQEPVPPDPAQKKPESLRYWYPIEDLWTDGVTSSYAWGCWVRGVKVVTAGRNPLFLTRSKFCEIRDCEASEALFKGGGGTGYVGLERSFDCLMDSVVTHNMRHAPDLQWGSAGNVIRQGKFFGSDAQWHAGWTNENLLEGNLIVSDERAMAENNAYGYGLFSTGPSDPLHGPEGPRNVAYYNDITSPRDGLHMNGGNEAWIIAYNRFRIAEGLAVYGKEKSFDHIIRGNVFVIQKGAGAAVQFDEANCSGIELLDNTFYGPVGKLARFLNGVGQFAREENNRILPYSADAPLPAPEVKSVFAWQRSLGGPAAAQR